MTIRAKLELLAAALLLCASAIIVSSWSEYRTDRLQMQSTLTSQKLIIEQAQQQIKALQEGNKNRDKATQSAVAQMHRTAAQIQTPLQIANWIPSQLHTPSPIRFSMPTPTPSNPSPDAIATIPERDLLSLREVVESCKECKLELQTAKRDLASTNQQLQLAGEQLSATQRQRDAALAVAKGGTFWRRLKTNTRWFLMGIGTGAVTLCATGHCR